MKGIQLLYALLLSTAMFVLVQSGFAQAGKDGARSVTAANTVLNTYTRLSANANAGSTSLTVANSNMKVVLLQAIWLQAIMY